MLGGSPGENPSQRTELVRKDLDKVLSSPDLSDLGKAVHQKATVSSKN